MDSYIQIAPQNLLIAAALVVINLLLSYGFRLGLGRDLLWASIRMSVQLWLVGYVLGWVFALESPWPVLAVSLVMSAVAAQSAIGRSQRRYPEIYWNSLISILASTFLVSSVGVLGVLQVEPWFDPQYWIPILGMLLGNILNGISLALDRFLQGLSDGRFRVEAALALGASAWEAAHPEVREALRIGMIPTINSMMVMGIVSLPGMMTGQILAGADPQDAVLYQIAIMFMIAAATALGALAMVLLTFRFLFRNHRLLSERLS